MDNDSFEQELLALIDEAFDAGVDTDVVISALELRLMALKEVQ